LFSIVFSFGYSAAGQKNTHSFYIICNILIVLLRAWVWDGWKWNYPSKTIVGWKTKQLFITNSPLRNELTPGKYPIPAPPLPAPAPAQDGVAL
jgi:hypothetical protein